MSCPGWYCGRTLREDGSYSDCGSCERGFRRNDTTFICEPCTDAPTFYDWLYLGFMALLALVLHWFFIDMVAMKTRYPSRSSRNTPFPKHKPFDKDVIVLHLTALLEITLASILTIFFTHPFGEFRIQSCTIKTLADWYTLMHNPIPNYEKKVICTQEAVYPLYTTVFVFYIFALILMLLIRPWMCRRFLPRQSKMSIYAAMYFFPILSITHALVGGLVYYSFPYLVVVLSVISCAYHFAAKIDQSVMSLVITTVVDPRNIIILIGHWLLHAYGIIAITQLSSLTHALFILLVPLPALFYIFTARFTDPNKFQF